MNGKTFYEVFNLRFERDCEYSNASVHTTRRLVIMYRQIKFGRKRISSSENMVKLVFRLYDSLLWSRPRKYQTIFLCNTPAHLTHQDTKFDYSGSENIIWTKRLWNFGPSLWPWPWTQQTDFFFHSILGRSMMYQQTKFGCRRILTWENVEEI